MDKSKAPFETAELIFRYIQNKLSEEEGLKLEQWLQKEPENKKLFDRIISEKAIRNKLKKYEGYDLDKAWEKIAQKKTGSGKTRIMPVRKLIGYAAAISIPLLIGAYYLFLNNHAKEMPGLIVAGTQKAVLTLGNGKTLELTPSEEENVIRDHKVVILHAKKTLDYQAKKVPGEETREPVFNTLETPRGGEYDLVLSDGTKVWLNAASRIVYPVEFTGDERRIELQGEAYFEVAGNKEKPFIVAVPSMEVRVLGTSFNVMAYRDESHIETTLVEGRVEIATNKENNNKLELTPGQQARYSKVDGDLEIENVDTYACTAWKDGKFVIDNESLETILRRLGRWYDFNTEYLSQDIREYHFSGTLDRYDKIDVILEMFSLATNLDFNINGNIIIASKADR